MVYSISEKNIGKLLLDSNGKTFYGRECKTLRYLYAPLDSSTTRTISDFFFVSDGISVISTQAIDLGFENSDHNPVIAVVAL